MRHPRLIRRTLLTSATALILAGAVQSTLASAAGTDSTTTAATAPGDLTAYTGVDRIADDDGSDPAKTQATLDDWTPEAMRSAISMDQAPGATTGTAKSATGRGTSSTNTPVITPPSRQHQPAPSRVKAHGDSSVHMGAPTGPVDVTSADAAPAVAGDKARPMSNDGPTDGLPSVGALFFNIGPVHERCTGTVINTGSKNIIATAGHCLWTKPVSWLPGVSLPDPVFVPGYHDGQAPYGKWSVKSRYIATAWKKDLNPDYDYGFFVLNDSKGQRIQDVVGGNAWRTDAGTDNRVEVTGYPDNRDQPLQCFTTTKKFQNYASQLVFPCDNFHTGVSGSLLMENFGQPKADLGTAIASLGGYQQGGDSDNISYAVLWNSNTAALINAAVRGQ